YGKRTPVDQFSVIGRGGQGVICMKLSDRNGALVGAAEVKDEDEVILISDQGTLVRTRVQEVSLQGRNTQGVKLINLSEDEALVGLASFNEPTLDNGEAEADSTDHSASIVGDDSEPGVGTTSLQASDQANEGGSDD
ncbi:MAG: DNA gyrase C-terminal beta-propeller domain-containing protein, partial [Pseudomonadales bacterium]